MRARNGLAGAFVLYRPRVRAEPPLVATESAQTTKRAPAIAVAMINVDLLKSRFALLRVLWPYLLFAWFGVGISLAFWRDTVGWNLLSEVIGATFGVLFIDVAIEAAETRRLRPARLAMMREAVTAYRRLNGLIGDVLRASLQAGHRPAPGGFESDEMYLGWVLAKLDLSTTSPNAGVVEQRLTFFTWREALVKRLSFSAKEVERFVTRYASVSDPELHEAMQQLENTNLVSFGAAEDLMLAVVQAVGEGQWAELVGATSKLHPILRRLIAEYGIHGDRSTQLEDPAGWSVIQDLKATPAV